ncbi:hypothetical protein [Streptomyces glaucus]|uniref:Uncharacterized protein n=1 Tax=Streptomyces glaucus TaxID=284029 RepID=A0ABN3JTX3_9ACTN
MTETTARPEPADPCGNTAPHLAHRNWQSEQCGVCPGREQARPSRYPHRLRLYGGRNTHAAEKLAISGDLLTACDYDAGAAYHRMPDTSAVTCRACQRVLAKEKA